jgi:hypothetical protein
VRADAVAAYQYIYDNYGFLKVLESITFTAEIFGRLTSAELPATMVSVSEVRPFGAKKRGNKCCCK